MLPKCLVILMPGAGLEPARTLPGPRDFKSTEYCHHEQPTCGKVLYQRRVSTGTASFCSFQHDGSGTGKGTIKLQPKGRKQPDSIGTVDFQRR
jgi:hypothetical protein